MLRFTPSRRPLSLEKSQVTGGNWPKAAVRLIKLKQRFRPVAADRAYRARTILIVMLYASQAWIRKSQTCLRSTQVRSHVDQSAEFMRWRVFAFQARVYVAELAEALAGSSDSLHASGDVFVEALSDIAKWETAKQLVLLQAKRTLTPATLESAAGEIAAIESFIATTRPELVGTIKYGVVSAFTSKGTQWTDLATGSAHKSLIQSLAAHGRLLLH